MLRNVSFRKRYTIFDNLLHKFIYIIYLNGIGCAWCTNERYSGDHINVVARCYVTYQLNVHVTSV